MFLNTNFTGNKKNLVNCLFVLLLLTVQLISECNSKSLLRKNLRHKKNSGLKTSTGESFIQKNSTNIVDNNSSKDAGSGSTAKPSSTKKQTASVINTTTEKTTPKTSTVNETPKQSTEKSVETARTTSEIPEEKIQKPSQNELQKIPKDDIEKLNQKLDFLGYDNSSPLSHFLSSQVKDYQNPEIMEFESNCGNLLKENFEENVIKSVNVEPSTLNQNINKNNSNYHKFIDCLETCISVYDNLETENVNSSNKASENQDEQEEEYLIPFFQGLFNSYALHKNAFHKMLKVNKDFKDPNDPINSPEYQEALIQEDIKPNKITTLVNNKKTQNENNNNNENEDEEQTMLPKDLEDGIISSFVSMLMKKYNNYLKGKEISENNMNNNEKKLWEKSFSEIHTTPEFKEWANSFLNKYNKENPKKKVSYYDLEPSVLLVFDRIKNKFNKEKNQKQ